MDPNILWAFGAGALAAAVLVFIYHRQVVAAYKATYASLESDYLKARNDLNQAKNSAIQMTKKAL